MYCLSSLNGKRMSFVISARITFFLMPWLDVVMIFDRKAILWWLGRVIIFLELRAAALLSSAKVNSVLVVREWLKMWLDFGASWKCRLWESMWNSGQILLHFLVMGMWVRECVLRFPMLLLDNCAFIVQSCWAYRRLQSWEVSYSVSSTANKVFNLLAFG